MSFKVFIFSIPATGHTNPLAVVLERLIAIHKTHVIWYTIEKYRHLVEKIGAEFREIKGVTDTDFETHIVLDSHLMPYRYFTDVMLRLIDYNVNNIVRDILIDEPHFIISDSMGVHLKWAMKLLDKNIDDRSKLPKVIYFSSIFAYEHGIYPSHAEFELLFNSYSISEKFKLAYDTLYLYSKYMFKLWSYGLKIEYPHKDIFETDPSCLKLVTTFPEFQARYELLNKNTKFIGACLNEDLRETINNEALESVLARFPSNTEKLIYISMGTLFNKNKNLFKIVLSAIKEIEHSLKLIFIVSTGGMDSELNCFNDTHILLMPNVPQLKVLQKSSLFIAHCVAHRVANELKLGVYIDYTKLSPQLVKDKITQVLNDSSFNERLGQYSKLSRQLKGKLIGADIIFDYMNRTTY